MLKEKLGMRIYTNKKTPKLLKSIIYFRWTLILRFKEKRERLKNKDNIFEVYMEKRNKVLFRLPVKNELISGNIIVKKAFYEHDLLQSIGKVIENPLCILDVGANIGNHTLFFSKYWKNTTFYAFEPSISSFEILQDNIELNNLDTTYCYNVAVGSKSGTGSISYDGMIEKNLGATRVEYDKNGEIKFIALDEFTREKNIPKIDLVKIDVEGFELSVLEGMKETIKNHNPFIWIEVLENNKIEAMKLFKELNLSFVAAPEFNKHNDYLLKRNNLINNLNI